MRCPKERREVLCATDDSTLVYRHHVIQLSTKYDKSRVSVLSEWPFQNPEIANHPDADQKINFNPPVEFTNLRILGRRSRVEQKLRVHFVQILYLGQSKYINILSPNIYCVFVHNLYML